MGVIFKDYDMNLKNQKTVEIVREIICEITGCAPSEPWLWEKLKPIFDPPEIDSPLVKRIKIERDRLQGHLTAHNERRVCESNDHNRITLQSAVHTCDDIIEIVKEFEKEQK